MLLRALPLCCLLLVSTAVRAADTITLTIGDWQPYAAENAPYHGPVPRIVSEAFALEGIEVRFVFRPWNRAYQEAAKGNANGSAIWSTSPRDTDRNRRFYFTDAIFEGESVFFHLKSRPFTWNGYAQLRGMTIGGNTGYEYAFERDPQIRVDKSAASDELNFQKLLAGRFPLFAENLDVGLYVMRHALPPDQAALITWDARPYNRPRYFVMLSKMDPASPRYVQAFNRGLQKLKDSGRYQQYMNALRRDAP